MPEATKVVDGTSKEINSLISLSRSTNDYPLHPEGGPYPAVLSEIRMHKDVETRFGTKDRLQLIFQTSEKLRDHTDGIDDDRPMELSAFVNATLSDKGRLMGFITQQVSATELDAKLANGQEVDVENLLVRKQFLLVIEHNESNGRTYANIINAMKAPTEQQITIWDDEGGL